MIPEIANFALTLALAIAVVQGIVPLVGAQKGIDSWMQVARPAVYVQFGLVTFALICLGYVFVIDDFTVKYVATHSNTDLPLAYKLSAVWGGHEGSFLLWVAMHAGWSTAVAYTSQKLPRDAMARVLAVLGLLSVGLLIYLVFTSNPFDRLLPNFPVDGKDLNPQLQDPGLIIHPPMLFMGYVGFAVAFAFAISALISGELDSAWARWSRPWTAAAWVFLTIGIALGSWWAYYELGWGGWWFWDPVENASFMPWLVGTALMHSLAVTDKRGLFKSWTVLLAISAFSLSLLGTFLVRSGILVSVHSFASDPERGIVMLAFLGVVIGCSFTLFAIRAGSVISKGDFGWVSREILLLMNNLGLAVVTFVVLLGTLYPILSENPSSVGPPFYNPMFAAFMSPLVFLLAMGPAMRWRNHSPQDLLRSLWVTFVSCAVLAIVIPHFFTDDVIVYMYLAVFLTLWVVATHSKDIWKKVAHRKAKLEGLKKIPRSYYGMWTAHIGVAIALIGMVVAHNYSIEKDVRVSLDNNIVSVAGYDFVLKSLDEKIGPNYVSDMAVFDVQKSGETFATLKPEKRRYNASGTVTTEVDIHINALRDIYVAMGEPLDNTGAWAVRLYYKPFVRWIWIGCALMALGGILSISDKRYRIKIQTKMKMASAS